MNLAVDIVELDCSSPASAVRATDREHSSVRREGHAADPWARRAQDAGGSSRRRIVKVQAPIIARDREEIVLRRESDQGSACVYRQLAGAGARGATPEPNVLT